MQGTVNENAAGYGVADRVYLGSECMYEGRDLLLFWGSFGQFPKHFLHSKTCWK